MMQFFSRFIKNGNLKPRVSDAMAVFGIGTIFATAYFFEKWEGWLFWLLMIVGSTVARISAFGGLAEKFGYKPFTNDPLGWRAAKKSYESEASQDENPKIKDVAP